MTRPKLVSSLLVLAAVALAAPYSYSQGKGAETTAGTSETDASPSEPEAAVQPTVPAAAEPAQEDAAAGGEELEPEHSEEKGRVPARGTDVPDWRAAASPEQQAQARKLFQEGNELVKESLFIQAVEEYEAALSHWDHPGIHYNLALALINLDQPVRLRRHLIESLKFGEAALGRDKARRAKQYIALVEKQLTDLRIRSEHPGARVELDGQFLFTAPSEYRDFVRAGQHTVKATAPGYETTERALSLVAGESVEVPVRLYRPEDWIQSERRWKMWGPITVTASGAAVLGVGFALYGVGAQQVRDFDAKVKDECRDGGCAAGVLDDSPDGGENLQGVGIATIAVGGATLVTGGVLLYLNRPIPHRVDPEAGDKLSLAPVLGPGFVGLTGRGVF